jgi:diguanylate cyclase (GGDEF)-like protein
MLEIPLDRRLQAVLAVAEAVAAAYEFEEVVEIAAEEARANLGVSLLSISRWHAQEGELRTLINVGEVQGFGERWPTDEVYTLEEFPAAREVIVEGRARISHLGHPDCDAAERALLEEWSLASCAAVPITSAEGVWGEMWAANGPERLPLRPADVHFMQAISSQVALAFGRAELYSQLVAAAYRDTLTGLANRRAFDEELGRAIAGPVALLLGDVDGLKGLNDSAGHEAGDAALRAVGEALAGCGVEGTLAARIGGDEFCLILEGRTREQGETLAASLTETLAGGDPPVSVSWGVAAQAGGGTTADLLRAADAAQYEAKRSRGRRARDVRGRRVAHGELMREALAVLHTLESDPARLAAAVAALRAL